MLLGLFRIPSSKKHPRVVFRNTGKEVLVHPIDVKAHQANIAIARRLYIINRKLRHRLR